MRDGFTVESFTNCLKSYYAPARLTFSHLLLEIARTNSAASPLHAGERVMASPLADSESFPWCPEELSVLNALSTARTLEELREATGLNEPSLARVLGVLRALNAVETASDATPLTNGAIAEIAPFDRLIPVVPNLLDEKLAAARNGSAFTSEQFKNLKVLITEANSVNPLKVLTVSSPDTRDGKSLISANLAFSFAMDPGRRVLIIDCDLRNPALARYLGVPTDPGLLQYMWNNGRLEPHCYLRRTENLYFMTAGGTALNPIEILSMQKMKRLVEILRRDFDTIILDAPPYHPIADARVVTGMSDGLLMVVRRGKTSYASSDRAFKAVDRDKLLGVVFNDVKPMPFDNGYNYEYYSNGRGRLNEGSVHNGKYLES
jgi:capsular exopolysaccharide synthesis family protein